MLILNNASVPVNNESETYTSVMKAWAAALEAMNNLVKGIPQRVQDRAALLGISSWHLYPDMRVYGASCTEVKQKDPLFDSTAFLTLGLQHVRDDTKSVYWSLPLACLQYYGHPIKASRTVGQDNSRPTYQKFAYVILGCLFAGWGEFATTNEDGLQWVETLAGIMGLSQGKRHKNMHKLKWLSYLATAPHGLIDCNEAEKKSAHQLIHLGRRRSTFLQPVRMFLLRSLVSPKLKCYCPS